MDTQQDTTEMTPTESVEYVIKNLSVDVVTLREILNVIGREEMMVFCTYSLRCLSWSLYPYRGSAPCSE